MSQSDLEREILRPLWKVHILHHASEGPIIGNWMLEELREHGYNVSPGTLYPMLARLCRLGWLEAVEREPARARNRTTHYRLTKVGGDALAEVQSRLSELQREVFAPRSKD
ncbi:MAG TPA: helix-turn-helix transcriptional regulator [Opitutaceae bacterium]